MKIGDRVKIERNEKLYPIRGTWRQYRNKYGVLSEINKQGMGSWEYGVVIDGRALVWFKKHEVRPLKRKA